jgi:drug/metabolite transporter (DMT)-like permease
MNPSGSAPRPWHAAAVAGAFAIVYVVWGSTYLAIRVGVQTMPPMVLGGLRFLLSGPLMIAVGLLLGGRFWTTRKDTFRIVIQGSLLLVGGNGLVSWGEQWVPSNLAALIVASTALWMALLGRLGAQGERFNVLTWVGLLLGFAGVAVLVTSGAVGGTVSWKGFALLLGASISWAVGSVFTRRFPVQASSAVVSGGQMLTAGLIMSAIGLLDGEFARWNPSNLRAWYVIGYLVVFGSCIGFSAFQWLVHEVTPARLGTYAYVNPAVAVLLGSWLLNETLSPWQVVGTLIILSGVVIVTITGAPQRR